MISIHDGIHPELIDSSLDTHAVEDLVVLIVHPERQSAQLPNCILVEDN